jgi:TonB-linked SusC/RagA family outer membrane protein
VPYNSWQFADFSSATGVNTSLNPDAIKGGYGRYSKNNSSYFGRINYDYKEKYLASVSTRIDGSTVFGSENKYGIFPSGSLGWVVTKENFFQSKMIDLLKIRGSYGATGNDGVDPQYSAIQTDYLASLYSNGNSIGYTYGNSFVTGASLASLGNENLKWEANTQLNVGFDVYFLKNKFNITADYYQRKTNNLLYKPDGSLTLGAINLPYANIGSTKNSGVDILLGYKDNLAKDLRIMTNLTFTSGKNMVTETNNTGTARILGGGYFNGQAQTVTVFEKGKSPGYFYGYKTAGLFQSQKEINDSPTQNGAQPGDIKFVDINGDGVIDVKDQTEIGNPFPKFTMGWTLNLEYKNFDLSVFTYVSEGNDIYRAYERNANYTNKFQSVLNRWTGPGTTNDARYPRYSFIDANNNSRVSDRYVEDGSFIKIKNILLGYNIQARPIKKIFKSLRIYGQVKNAFTFTKYSGFDPEIGSSYLLANGVDLGAYPQSRTYSIGLDIKF